MADDEHLWTILDLQETEIPQLRRLEKLLNDFQQDCSDKDKLLDSSDTLIRILENLCTDAYPIFRTIDLSKRKILRTRISNQWQQFQKKLKQILPRSTWETLQYHAQTFSILCTFDFHQQPLLFAKQALNYKHMTIKLESQLIELIENMRKQHPQILDDILNDEYKKLKDCHHGNIVITVLGSTKSSKSSLINFILEDEICPTENRAATARLTRITYGPRICLNVNGKNPESYIFDNTKQLLAKAIEIIILKNEDRKSLLCHDEVFIQLPIEQLKGLELWDIPGFDENHVINNRIKDILQNTDLILAVLAQHESLRQMAIDFIKPCLEQTEENKHQIKICFIISQIDRFQSNGQSEESREAFLQHIYDKICTELPMNFPKIDYQNSDQFIPMCSRPRHNLKDYLECRQLFINKSCQWFNQALICVTRDRTDFLLKSIREFSNYENIFLQQARFQRMKKNFNEYFQQFHLKLSEKIKLTLNEISTLMKQSIYKTSIECRDLFYEKSNFEQIEQHIQTQITQKLKETFENKIPQIMDIVNEMFVEFSNTIELKPTEIQKLKQVLNDTLEKDHYSNIIKQYQHTSPYHLSSYFSRIFHAVSETLKATIKISIGDLQQIREAWNQFTKREEYMQMKTIESITELVNEILDVISDKIQIEIEKRLKIILYDRLNNIEENIEKQLQKYLHSSIIDTKINRLRQFSKDYIDQIKQIHLDILDLQFKLDFSHHFHINLQERLDQNNHFQIFTGTLTENKHPIAIKPILLQDFHLQEVLFIREIKHRNLIKYYGVKKIDAHQYYIIMPRFDCNLIEYLNNHLRTIDSSIINNKILQIIKGLNYIHIQLELIHGNIRVDNILVHQTKNRFIIGQLGGIHRNIDYYSPPEVFSSDYSSINAEKYDIYSLGMTIREIIRLSHLSDILLMNWLKSAKKCCLEQPIERPTCQKLLELHL